MTANILHPAPVSTALFHWDPASRQYIAEISDLGPGFRFGRVYADACDEGLTLVSARTGDELVFAVNREDRDSDGDVTGWILAPADNRPRGFTLRIFND